MSELRGADTSVVETPSRMSPPTAPAAAAIVAAEKPAMTSTPHKRKGDDINKADKVAKTAGSSEDEEEVMVVDEGEKGLSALSREQKLQKFNEGMQRLIEECP
jgi:hypothetical protein